MEQPGGKFQGLKADSAVFSLYAIGQFDALPFRSIGQETKTGNGVLINTPDYVHYEFQVGNFSDIGPGARLV